MNNTKQWSNSYNVGVGSLFMLHTVSILIMSLNFTTACCQLWNWAMHYWKLKTAVRHYLPFSLHFCSLYIQGSRNKQTAHINTVYSQGKTSKHQLDSVMQFKKFKKCYFLWLEAVQSDFVNINIVNYFPQQETKEEYSNVARSS